MTSTLRPPRPALAAVGSDLRRLAADCRVCGAPLVPFLDHGSQPLSNGFVPAERLADVPHFPIWAGFCPGCFLVQLGETVPPDVLFTADYPFVTGTSQHMIDHYDVMAAELRQRHRPRSVLEIGPNDGTLLQHFRDLRHLGVEPAAGVASLARARGCNVRTAFWNEQTAAALDIAPVDLVVAAHVVTHIPDLDGFLRAVTAVLAPDGLLVLEDPSLDQIVQRNEFDQVYDEHVYYLSAPAVQRVLARHGMELIDCQPQPVHGGSMRYTAAGKGAQPVSRRVAGRLQHERYLTSPATLHLFGERAGQTISRLRQLVRSLRTNGQLVAAYGATSKSAITFTRCGFTPDDIAYISDTTPQKQGRVQGGTGIPVIGRDEAQDRLPDTWVLSAWNHRREIVAKERPYLEQGGRFLLWVPEVLLLGVEDV